MNRKIIRWPVFILGLILFFAGLVYNQWWWQTGAGILTVLAVELIFAYLVMD